EPKLKPMPGEKGTAAQFVGVNPASLTLGVEDSYELAMPRPMAGPQLVGLVMKAALPPLTRPFSVSDIDCSVIGMGTIPSTGGKAFGRLVNVETRRRSPGMRTLTGPESENLPRTPPSGRTTMPMRAGSDPVGVTR